MPTYDYVCKSCDHRFEEFQSMSAKVLRTCPKCGKKTLERLIGIGAGVLFKGGGFYETDYRSESYTKSAEAEKKASEPVKAESSSKDGADTTKKTETKSESASSSRGDKADKGEKAEKAAPAPKSDAAPKAKKSSAKKNG
jgi:putative FmdB family regulatory protein